MGNCHVTVEPISGIYVDQKKTENIIFKTVWEDSPTEMYGYCGTMNGVEFKAAPNNITCDATMGHLTKPCTHVHVVPKSFEVYGDQRLFFHESLLTIYTNVKIAKMFVFNDVSKMFSPYGHSNLKCCTYYKGSHSFKFHEVCIISSRLQLTREQLLSFRKKHRLVISIDCPSSHFFVFPRK